jgi:hypothetical protein
MVEAIHECKSEEELAESTSLVLQKVLCEIGHGTFPDRQLNKDFVRFVAGAFRDKVQDIVGGSQDKGKRASILKFVIDVVFDELHERIKEYK